MQPIRIGILGAARIAPQAIILPAHLSQDAIVTCIAARDLSRARLAADQYGIAQAVHGYSALLARNDVDLVYNALPASLHESWSIAALEAGKAVLCEKPFAGSSAEARRMVDAARRCGRPLVEAFHYRFHALMRRMEEAVSSGLIGKIESASAHFEGMVPRRPGELRWEASCGGGALMDLGCYPVHALRTLLGDEAAVIEAGAEWIEGVDASDRASLVFPGGVRAAVSCSMVAPVLDSAIELIGSEGRLRATNFVLPHRGATLVLERQGSTRALPIVGPSTYDAQLAHIVALLRGEAEPLTGGEDAVSNLRLIEAIRAAAPPPAG